LVGGKEQGGEGAFAEASKRRQHTRCMPHCSIASATIDRAADAAATAGGRGAKNELQQHRRAAAASSVCSVG
jgi:hypothetical protein